MKNQNYSVKKVIVWIEDRIHQNVFKSGCRLPTVQVLAKKLKVSGDTIRCAAHALAMQNKIVIQKNRGMFVAPVQTFFPEDNGLDSTEDFCFEAPPKYLWKHVQSRMKEDILNGAFIHEKYERIPSIKELQSMYSASYKPIKKAVAALYREGILTADGRTRIYSSFSGRSPSAIVLVTSINLGVRESISDRSYFFLKLVEVECKKMNSDLCIVQYSQNLAQEIDRVSKKYVLRGFITYCFFNEESIGCVSVLKSFGLPMSIIDMDGGLHLAEIHAKLHIFNFASIATAGTEIARLLLSLGHKRIAFISCLHSNEFSQKRFASLRTTFESARKGNSVQLFAVENPVPNDALGTPLTRNKAYTCIQSSLDTMAQLTKDEGHLAPIVQAMHSVADRAVGDDTYYHNLLPLFKQALLDRTVSAWVFADDRMALPSLYFLNQCGIHVPEDISVAGFEDMYEALPAGLTTYNFNMPTLVLRCLQFIRFPKENFGPRGNRPVDIPGYIITRKTTGPANACI